MVGSPLMTVKSLMNGTTEPTDMMVMCGCVMDGWMRDCLRGARLLLFCPLRCVRDELRQIQKCDPHVTSSREDFAHESDFSAKVVLLYLCFEEATRML